MVMKMPRKIKNETYLVIGILSMCVVSLVNIFFFFGEQSIVLVFLSIILASFSIICNMTYMRRRKRPQMIFNH